MLDTMMPMGGVLMAAALCRLVSLKDGSPLVTTANRAFAMWWGQMQDTVGNTISRATAAVSVADFAQGNNNATVMTVADNFVQTPEGAAFIAKTTKVLFGSAAFTAATAYAGPVAGVTAAAFVDNAVDSVEHVVTHPNFAREQVESFATLLAAYGDWTAPDPTNAFRPTESPMAIDGFSDADFDRIPTSVISDINQIGVGLLAFMTDGVRNSLATYTDHDVTNPTHFTEVVDTSTTPSEKRWLYFAATVGTHLRWLGLEGVGPETVGSQTSVAILAHDAGNSWCVSCMIASKALEDNEHVQRELRGEKVDLQAWRDVRLGLAAKVATVQDAMVYFFTQAIALSKALDSIAVKETTGRMATPQLA